MNVPRPFPLVLSLVARDVDHMVKRLVPLGADLAGPIHYYEDGRRSAAMHSPDGLSLGLYEASPAPPSPDDD